MSITATVIPIQAELTVQMCSQVQQQLILPVLNTITPVVAAASWTATWHTPAQWYKQGECASDFDNYTKANVASQYITLLVGVLVLTPCLALPCSRRWSNSSATWSTRSG
jgi:hypothetical protein